jgi:hypothetical protein
LVGGRHDGEFDGDGDLLGLYTFDGCDCLVFEKGVWWYNCVCVREGEDRRARSIYTRRSSSGEVETVKIVSFVEFVR